MNALVQLNPNHVESRLVAAEQAIAQAQWFDARSALEPLTHGPPTARACVLMAEIAQEERGDMTAAHVGHKMAIILDDKVNSAPVIQGAIRGGASTITMGSAKPQVAQREADDLVDVLRTGSLPAPLVPPLGIVKVKPGLFHTQGGLLVDAHARVRREGGGVVPNLFAGGGAAAGISGRSGAGGYASGNGLLTALGLGRLAGLRAAAEVRGEA